MPNDVMHTQDRYPNETVVDLRDILARHGFVRGDNGCWHHRYSAIRELAEIVEERDAMKIALDLIAAGVARIEPTQPEREAPLPLWGVSRLPAEPARLRFDGKLYDIADTWTATINAIGWDRSRAALAGKGSA